MTATPFAQDSPAFAGGHMAMHPGRLLVATGAAAGLNVLVLRIGASAGASLSVVAPSPIQSRTVVLVTVVVMVGAAAPVWFEVPRHPKVALWSAWGGLTIALVTALLPLGEADDAATGITLAIMHVITGVTWFAVVIGDCPRPAPPGAAPVGSQP